MNPIAIVCPTRGRPGECIRMVRSALEAEGCDALLYVDEDDQARAEYDRECSSEDRRLKLFIGEHVGRGEAVNRLCSTFNGYRIYLMVSDDITFDRTDWPDQVTAAMDSFGDDLGCVHLESENGERYVNWAAVSRRWINALGWFNYPGCRWFCQDTIVQALAEAMDRVVFIRPKVLTHHVVNHPEVRARFLTDAEAFLWYMARQFGSDLAKLRAVARS